MRCPYCQNENKYDALSCEFCMKELPLSSARQEEIKQKKKIETKIKFSNSLTRFIGTMLGVLLIIGVIVIVWLLRR